MAPLKLAPTISALLRRSFSAVAGDVRPNSEASARNGKLERIAEDLLSLTAEERKDYTALLRIRLGLPQFGPAAAVSGPGGGGDAAAQAAEEVKEEKMAFDVKLDKFEAAAKIKVIKEVRAVTDLGLKEAKELVEKAPIVVKKGVTKEEAEAIANKLKEAGATVKLE